MLARLDGAGEQLPNLDLFVFMYAKKEAVLSSQIEGTQASLADILRAEEALLSAERQADVVETINYIEAMKYGLERARALPFSLRLIREIHSMLMSGVRGSDRTPGEFRVSQNWIGPSGTPLKHAMFVPPPPHEMKEALGEFELYLHSGSPMPPLIKIGLAHAQFETIHPFLDGNGRIGRLLIMFLLCHWRIIHRPLLYPSLALKQRRTEYYDRLQAVRDHGHWEEWLVFFLEAMADAAKDAYERTRLIIGLREEHRGLIHKVAGRSAGSSLRALDNLFTNPYVKVSDVASTANLSPAAAGQLVARFVDHGILEEYTGRKRGRKFAYDKYIQLLEDDIPLSD